MKIRSTHRRRARRITYSKCSTTSAHAWTYLVSLDISKVWHEDLMTYRGHENSSVSEPSPFEPMGFYLGRSPWMRVFSKVSYAHPTSFYLLLIYPLHPTQFTSSAMTPPSIVPLITTLSVMQTLPLTATQMSSVYLRISVFNTFRHVITLVSILWEFPFSLLTWNTIHPPFICFDSQASFYHWPF